ncbi:hypothetical protein E2562_033236 [Oryza meyeriana var. granulata]|uniref:Pentatricopeptide repeat-containing protein-mitochondrial domain-containing protein n=1 Tax=Oryza meyeriana var. granulata TaxID=110450 RepID=A0A6G1BPQ5_9ORYZ|nr:hypothetical protein E2562_033236 [Oryza meyeriana var. granulata]
MSMSPSRAHTEAAESNDDDALLALLRDGHTDAAYRLFDSDPSLPDFPVTASRLLAQLSYRSTKRGPDSFSRAAALLHRLRARGALHLLDANTLSLAARSNNPHLAYSLLLSMLRRGLLPDRSAYTAALARLPPARALRLFDAIPTWNAPPDALTYNVVIKMCARAGRKDLIARVLERILSSGLTPCATTFHSLVAAYVGFGGIPTAERIVQAMRERRTDICLLLRAGVHHAHEGYMNAGRVDNVVAMMRAMRREAETAPASRPDHVTYTTVISTLVAAGDMERARAVLEEMG